MAKEPESWTMENIVKKATPPALPDLGKSIQASIKKAKAADPKFAAKVDALIKPHKETKMAKAKTAIKYVIPMHYKKDTPGTYVYESDDPDVAVTQIYIKKKIGMPDGKLDRIIITVEGE